MRSVRHFAFVRAIMPVAPAAAAATSSPPPFAFTMRLAAFLAGRCVRRFADFRLGQFATRFRVQLFFTFR